MRMGAPSEQDPSGVELISSERPGPPLALVLAGVNSAKDFAAAIPTGLSVSRFLT